MEKSYSVMEILKSPIQIIFLFAAVFTLGGLIPFTKRVYDFIQVAGGEKKPKDYEFPGLADFWMTVVSGLIFTPA